MSYSFCNYVNSNGTKLFSAFVLPHEKGRFPIVVVRTPYVDKFEHMSEADILSEYEAAYRDFTDHGYAVAVQHCRGCGKSDGDCIPYINEQADSRCFYDHLRSCDFYMGELYLMGGSYLSSVHLIAAPYKEDIKAAVLEIQDSERYNIKYRNGFFKSGLHGNWYVKMYRKKSVRKKNYTRASFNTLPLIDFAETVFGEKDVNFTEPLRHPDKNDPFWQTHLGGSDARGALDHANIPILMRTGFYDIYTQGVFDMWDAMDADTRAKSALIVTPNDHSDTHSQNSIHFENSKASERFPAYVRRWFDYVRGVDAEPPVEQGKITYYRIFEDKYVSEERFLSDKTVKLGLGGGKVTYTYNPYDPPAFKGGLSGSFGGAEYQDKPNSRFDIISNYTAPFENDAFVKGRMSARLYVSSDCEDTCFYVRVSIEKPEGDWGLRDDIRSLCFELGDYTPGDEVMLDFTFDVHAFKISAGERLRIDIASADNAHYVRHTNNKGLYSEQTTAKIAHNTVDLASSYLILPIE